MPKTIEVEADTSEHVISPFEMLTAHQLRIIKMIIEDGEEAAAREHGLEAVESCLKLEAATAVIEHKARNKAIAELVGKDDIVAGMYLSAQKIASGDETNATAKNAVISGLQRLGNALKMFEVQADPEEPLELEWLS